MAQGPGDGAGGGSVIKCRGQTRPFLLDRLSLQPDLADRKDAVPVTTIQSVVPRYGIEMKPQRNELGPFSPCHEPGIRIAKARLNSWLHVLLAPRGKITSSVILIAEIEDAIDHMSFKRTSHRFNEIPRYALSPALKAKCPDIKTAILWTPKWGAIISDSVWDPLDPETQAGLVIHEALRQMQGLYLYHFTDAQLQEMTAKIMDEAPVTGSYFAEQINDRPGRRILENLALLSPPFEMQPYCSKGSVIPSDAILRNDRLSQFIQGDLDLTNLSQRIRAQLLNQPGSMSTCSDEVAPKKFDTEEEKILYLALQADTQVSNPDSKEVLKKALQDLLDAGILAR